MDRQYAFINRVYTDSDGNSKVYEVVFSNMDFSAVSIGHFDYDGLLRLSADSSLIRDFVFEGQYLKCADVQHVLLNAVVEGSLNKETVYLDDPDDTVLDLLKAGVDGGFSVVDDRVCGSDEWTGNGLVNFSNIRFSQTTMSVYVRMVFGNGIRNLHLVRMQRGVLEAMPFKFIVPSSYTKKPPASKFIKKIKVNNKIYDLYVSCADNVFKDIVILSPVLVNKASCLHEKYLSVINVMKECLRQSLSDGQKLNWVGEKSEKEVFYGVNFKCSIKHLTRKDATDILNVFFGALKDAKSEDEFYGRIPEKMPPLSMFIIRQLYRMVAGSRDGAEVISTLNDVIQYYSKRLFEVDSFLYKTRVYMFFTGIKLTVVDPVIFGSNEPGCYTVVEEGLHYGD